MSRQSANTPSTQRRRTALTTTLLAGVVAAGSVGYAVDLVGPRELPILPPGETIGAWNTSASKRAPNEQGGDLVGYRNADSIGRHAVGMADSGMLESDSVESRVVKSGILELGFKDARTMIAAGLSSDAMTSQEPIARVADAEMTIANAEMPMVRGQTTSPAPISLVPPPELVSKTFDTPVDAAWQVPLVQENPPLMMNYETALAMVGGQHPAVGFAQARVRAAYADLSQAKALWLPTIRAGISYHRHDGNLQASGGAVNDVNRGSFQAGLGAGAVGAGTTPRPGLVAEFQVSDAIFRPRIAQRTAWAQQHARTSAFQQQLLDVALAYNDLLLAHQEMQVIQRSKIRTNELAELTANYADAGEGLQADADRMSTELNLIQSRQLGASERRSVAQNRLIEALSLDCVCDIQPSDVQLTPIYIVDALRSRGELISTALSHRPELKSLACFVAATCEEYKRQKYAPFLPSVLMGFSQTGFGGGLGSSIDNVNSRTDVDLLAVWEVRNLGFGERAARSRASAATHQAKFQQLQQMDRVAREIADGQTQIVHRGQQVAILQSAIEAATNSNERNLSRIKDGEGLPLEVLQSLQALEQAQLSYARAVAQHNESQFRLQWALGWPIDAISMR